jgi:hypothetical protein
VLHGVLQRFHAAEPHGSLDVLGGARRRALHAHRHRGRGRRVAQRGHQPGLGQHTRVDPAHEVVQRRRRALDRLLQAGELRGGGVGRASEQRPHQAQVDHQGDEVLLGSVVDVALEPPPGGVLRRHQAGAGRRHLRRTGGALGDPCLQVRRHGDVAQHQSGLRGEVVHETPLHRGERLAGRADHERSEQHGAGAHGDDEVVVGGRDEPAVGQHAQRRRLLPVRRPGGDPPEAGADGHPHLRERRVRPAREDVRHPRAHLVERLDLPDLGGEAAQHLVGGRDVAADDAGDERFQAGGQRLERQRDEQRREDRQPQRWPWPPVHPEQCAAGDHDDGVDGEHEQAEQQGEQDPRGDPSGPRPSHAHIRSVPTPGRAGRVLASPRRRGDLPRVGGWPAGGPVGRPPSRGAVGTVGRELLRP